MNPFLPTLEVVSRFKVAGVVSVVDRQKKEPCPVNRKYRTGEKRRAWLAANRERVRAYNNKWYAENKEKVNARQREYYKANPQRRAYLNAKQREYRAK